MTDSPHQTAYGTAIAQADRGGTATVNIGLNPEQIASLLQAAGAAAQVKIDKLAGQLKHQPRGGAALPKTSQRRRSSR